MTPRGKDPVEARLESERPYPRAAFRAELGSRLRGMQARGSDPGPVRRLVLAYAGSGLLLLAVAGIGLAGAGPLAA